MRIVLEVHILSACLLAVYLLFPFFPSPALHKVGHYGLVVAFFSGILLVVGSRPPVGWVILTLVVFLAFSYVLGKVSVALRKGKQLHGLKWVPGLLYLVLWVVMVNKGLVGAFFPS